MSQIRLTNPNSLRVYQEPFPYFIATAVIDQELVSSLLSWFEVEANWKLVEAEFYEQHELQWDEGQLQTSLSFLTSQAFLDTVRAEAESLFRRPFFDRVEWAVHKLVPGQRIRIHNDLLTTGETHRMILHINRGWSFSQGGFLMLFNSPNPADVHRVLMPVNGSLVGFEISETSSHAVSLVFEGERFAIVFSLYADS